jgi:hypothetical protein
MSSYDVSLSGPRVVIDGLHTDTTYRIYD